MGWCSWRVAKRQTDLLKTCFLLRQEFRTIFTYAPGCLRSTRSRSSCFIHQWYIWGRIGFGKRSYFLRDIFLLTFLYLHSYQGNVSMCLFYCMYVSIFKLFFVLDLSWNSASGCSSNLHFLRSGISSHVEISRLGPNKKQIETNWHISKSQKHNIVDHNRMWLKIFLTICLLT